MRAYGRRRSKPRLQRPRKTLPYVEPCPETLIILNQIIGRSFLAKDAIRSETQHLRVRFTALIRQYCVYI